MSDIVTPLAKGRNGDSERDDLGRFRPGWKGGPGNPDARNAWELRRRLNAAMDETCPKDELKAVLAAMVVKAKAGDVQAAKLILDKAEGSVLIRILEELEAVVAVRLGATNV
jgi:hypothetical protein